MSVSAKTRIVQYGAVSDDYVVQHLPKFVEGEYTILQEDYDYSFDCKVYHLAAVQNPSPRTGAASTYYVTENPDDWSDSPTNNPTLPSGLRFSYGRDDNRYGKLDDFVGVVIHNRDFSNSGDYLVQNHTFNGELDFRHLESDFETTHLMQNHETPTGEVTVQQYDLIVLASPSPFSYRNSVSTNVSIRLSNYVYPLDSGTVTLYLEGEEKNITTTPFYSGLGGFDALWANDKEFDYNTEINVEWRVYDEDTPPNEFVLKYWFRTVPDVVGPRISSVSPEDDETGVAVDTCIEFTLRDYECGVNIGTLELFVNNQEVLSSDMVITALSSSDGYAIRYCPTESFLYGDEIPVSIYVEDTADEPNYLFYTYSFTTETSNAPVIISTDPVPCRKYKPITQDVEIDIVDGGHGLDEDSILFSVDDKTISNPRKLPIIYRED